MTLWAGNWVVGTPEKGNGTRSFKAHNAYSGPVRTMRPLRCFETDSRVPTHLRSPVPRDTVLTEISDRFQSVMLDNTSSSVTSLPAVFYSYHALFRTVVSIASSSQHASESDHSELWRFMHRPIVIIIIIIIILYYYN